MRRGIQLVPRMDTAALSAWFALMLIGLATVYSCTQPLPGGSEGVHRLIGVTIVYNQMIWLVLGVTAALLCLLVPLRFFETFAFVFYGASIVALLAVFFVSPERAGTHRWLSLGPFSLQPSELAKVAFLFTLARFLAVREGKGPFFTVVGVFLLSLPPFLLVLKEPDLGTALVFLILGVPMMFWSGVRASFLLALFSPLLSGLAMFYGQQVLHTDWPWAIYVVVLLFALFYSRLYMLHSVLLVVANLTTGLGIPLIWDKLQSYQQQRILTFFRPGETDHLGVGYQVYQSKVAIGSGGILGKGYLHGTQKGLAFLPERHTDFIFSVLGEELGLVGALLVIGLFLIIFIRAMRIAVKAKRPFASLLAVGVGSYFFFQSFVNISITLGLLPVTGLPLPFITYGGSSMLASCLMMGLLLSVSARWSEV